MLGRGDAPRDLTAADLEPELAADRDRVVARRGLAQPFEREDPAGAARERRHVGPAERAAIAPDPDLPPVLSALEDLEDRDIHAVAVIRPHLGEDDEVGPERHLRERSSPHAAACQCDRRR